MSLRRLKLSIYEVVTPREEEAKCCEKSAGYTSWPNKTILMYGCILSDILHTRIQFYLFVVK